MKLISIKNKSAKRIGRGISAGGGKTAGRGTKGQKSRSGYNIPRKFEGGQTPLSMRLPKLPGFASHKKKFTPISLDLISKNFKAGETVDLTALLNKGLIAKGEKAKILKNGTLTVAIKLGDGVAASRGVVTAIESVKPMKIEKTEESEIKSTEKPEKPAKKTTKSSK